MEYWQSWIVSSIVVLIGVGAKFLLEMFMPELKRVNHNLKRIFINALMTLFLVYLFGDTIYLVVTEPWTEDLQIFTLFRIFLFVAFGGFLLIMRTFRIFFDDSTDGALTEQERAKKMGEKFVLQK